MPYFTPRVAICIAIAAAGASLVPNVHAEVSTAISTQPAAAASRPTTAPARGTSAQFSKRAPKLLLAVSSLCANAKHSVAQVELNGRPLALATVVRADGYLLTKASELDGRSECKVRLADEATYDARVVASVPEHDLAMLHIAATGLRAIEWAPNETPRTIGQFVVSPGTDDAALSLGVISLGVRSSTGGVIGVRFPAQADTPDGVLVDRAEPGMPAEAAGIKGGDLIQKVNDQAFTELDKLMAYLRTLSGGTDVSVTVLRGQETIVFRVTLMSRAKLPTAPQAQVLAAQNERGQDLSRRKTDFPAVLQHDSVLTASQQGGPLIDLHGRAIGINIARAGRVETFALPGEIVQKALENMFVSIVKH